MASGAATTEPQHKPLARELWVDLIGLPFRRNGRGPDAYDCYGLLLELHQRQGIVLPSLVSPDTARGVSDAQNALMPHWQACPVRPGAALLFRDEGQPRHVGVAIDDDLFIHAAEGIGQVGLDRLSRAWGRLLIAAYTPLVPDR